MIDSRKLVCALACWSVLTFAPSVFAEAAQKAAAEAAFDEGAKLYAEKDFEEACERFEASQQLDPALGTTLRLADCYDKLGRTASAWATFKEAAAMAHAQDQADRETIALDRVEDLEARLTYVVIEVADATEELEDVEVLLNGNVVPRGMWGTPMPVDPGMQKLAAIAPNHEEWTHTVELADVPGERRLVVPQLVPLPLQEREPVVPRTDATAEDSEEEPDPGRTRRTIAYAGGAVGIVAMGLGGYFTLRAYDLNKQSNDQCLVDDRTACTEKGVGLREDARGQGNLATVFTATGLTLVGASLVVLVTAPSRKKQERVDSIELAARPQPGGAVFQLGGHW